MTDSMKRQLLAAAGAPALPDMYWYRVRFAPYSDHVVEISVRVDGPLLGSEALGSATFTLMDDGKRTVLEKAAIAAREAYADAFPQGA